MGTLSNYLADFSASTPGVTPSQSGLVALGVGVAQGVLNQLGHKLVTDGNYGPATRDTWQKEAIKRRLNPAFDRRNKSEAWVHPGTYRALFAAAPMTSSVASPKPVTKPKAVAKPATKVQSAPKTPAKSIAKVPAVAPAAAAAPSGTQDALVSDLQSILFGLGWTTKKLAADGKYGPRTANAWTLSSKLRKLDPKISRVSGTTARVSAATYAALSAAKPATAAMVVAATPTPAAAAPTVPAAAAPPTGMQDALVSDLQNILFGLGWTTKKLAADGKYGPQTANAWTSSSKLRKLDPKISRVDGKTARVSAATYAALSAAKPATAATVVAAAPPGTTAAAVDAASTGGGDQAAAADTGPPAPPGTIAIPQDAFDAAVLAKYTAPVLVSDLQKFAVASRKYPAVVVTGSWDNNTEAFYLDWAAKSTFAPGALPLFIQTLHTKLISADQQSIKLNALEAKSVATGAALYAQQQAGAPAPALPPGAEPSSITPTVAYGSPTQGPPAPYYPPAGGGAMTPSSGGITPVPVSYDSGGGGGGGGGGTAPPAPSPDAAAPAAPDTGAAAPADSWAAMVAALGTVGSDAKTFSDALEAAAKRGELHPDVKTAVIAWAQSADALKGHVAQLIDSSAPLKSALETAGTSSGMSGGLSALDRMFGGFGAVTDQLLSALKKPLPLTVGGKPLEGLGGRGFRGLGFGIIEWVVEFGEVVWPKLIQLLGTRAVTVAGGAAAAASGLDKVINGDVQAYQQHESDLAKMVADNKLTVDEYNALKQQPPGGGGSNFTWLVGGAVAVGGLALFLRHKRRSTAAA